ncbi:hydroxyacid oxidase 1-like [Daphnia pulicaria]|uniref:hydroxyacid oxidase 1-like n=1 Tax=Daphnia pulicaria TaxID=35523 RepID=UPI001EEBBF8D|nr:hydroxyacid oxidase 1-like [Daphnia pulicaria]
MAGKFVCVEDYENHAKKVLPSYALEYYRSGADEEQTLRENRESFKRWRLMPRMLRGVQNRSMNATALGCRVSAPFGIAPTAMQRMAHPDGECATAKAAAAHGIIYILSTIATSSIEEIAEAAPNGTNWFQLYIYKDRQATIDLIRRAEKANFKALVVTVDTAVLGRRLVNERHGFDLPPHLKLGNFDTVDEKSDFHTVKKEEGSRLAAYASVMFDSSLTWKDIDWLKSITKLPIVLKGILRPDDAELAVQHGVSAIGVSNHGGRQLDGVQATIDALPAIVKQVNGRCEVFLDGGVTKGTDVLKALALGAKMTFFGRPTLWGLAHSGEEGVKNIIQLLKTEIDVAMALSGCSSVDEIDSSLVLRQELYSNL